MNNFQYGMMEKMAGSSSLMETLGLLGGGYGGVMGYDMLPTHMRNHTLMPLAMGGAAAGKMLGGLVDGKSDPGYYGAGLGMLGGAAGAVAASHPLMKLMSQGMRSGPRTALMNAAMFGMPLVGGLAGYGLGRYFGDE
jgi:hypothetical protein